MQAHFGLKKGENLKKESLNKIKDLKKFQIYFLNLF